MFTKLAVLAAIVALTIVTFTAEAGRTEYDSKRWTLTPYT